MYRETLEINRMVSSGFLEVEVWGSKAHALFTSGNHLSHKARFGWASGQV